MYPPPRKLPFPSQLLAKAGRCVWPRRRAGLLELGFSSLGDILCPPGGCWPCWHSLVSSAVDLIQWSGSEGKGSGPSSPQDTEPQGWHCSARVTEAFQNSQRRMRARDPLCSNRKYGEGKVQTMATQRALLLLSPSLFPPCPGVEKGELVFPWVRSSFHQGARKPYAFAVSGRTTIPLLCSKP